MKSLSPEDWTAYWKDGQITTFGYGFSGNYDGEFEAFWRAQLAGLTGKLVDLCCGNGALIWLANDILNHDGNCCHLYGVDIADITPFKLLKKRRADYPCVEFLGNTSIDSLPFENNSINMAISQYGIEYADAAAVLLELDRVLTADGKLAFIVHSDQSSVIETARNTADVYNYLLGESGFFETAVELDRVFNTKSTMPEVGKDPQCRRLIGRLNQASYHAQHMHTNTGGDTASQKVVKLYIASVMRLFNGSVPVKSRKRARELAQWKETVVDTLNRMEDLTTAALSGDGLQHLLRSIEAAGFVLGKSAPILYGPEQLHYGTAIVAGRE